MDVSLYFTGGIHFVFAGIFPPQKYPHFLNYVLFVEILLKHNTKKEKIC